MNLEILFESGVFKWHTWKCLRVNTYILTSLARRARWATSTSRTLGKQKTPHFVNAILINLLKKILITQGEKYSQSDQVHQAHQEVPGNLEGPTRNTVSHTPSLYVILCLLYIRETTGSWYLQGLQRPQEGREVPSAPVKRTDTVSTGKSSWLQGGLDRTSSAVPRSVMHQ